MEVKVDIKNTDALSYAGQLPKGKVDLILIDPPYAISRDTNFQSGELKGDDTDRFRVNMDFGKWDVVDSEYFKALFKLYHKSLRRGGTCIIFYDAWKMQELKGWLEEAGFKMIRKCFWDKTNPVPLNRKKFYLSSPREEFLVCVKGGSPTYNMHWLTEEDSSSYRKQDFGIFEYPICHDKGRFHPTQKPLALIKELIEIHSNPKDLVVDTFLGSGTTAVAAIELGRDFAGCEKSEEYYPKIMERLG